MMMGFQISEMIGQQLLRTSQAVINFHSDAPLEFIEAKSDNCQGILNLKTGEFAFRVFIKTFDGFNNPLQRVHFYENYMEVNQFPEATFQGVIIEDLGKLSVDGSKLRAKGLLSIHGQSQERIIDVVMTMDNNRLKFQSQFEVLLSDYNIDIPNIVKQKISETIEITVKGILE
jgi:polyisoprenoid-binding protein YceI